MKKQFVISTNVYILESINAYVPQYIYSYHKNVYLIEYYFMVYSNVYSDKKMISPLFLISFRNYVCSKDFLPNNKKIKVHIKYPTESKYKFTISVGHSGGVGKYPLSHYSILGFIVSLFVRQWVWDFIFLLNIFFIIFKQKLITLKQHKGTIFYSRPECAVQWKDLITPTKYVFYCARTLFVLWTKLFK